MLAIPRLRGVDTPGVWILFGLRSHPERQKVGEGIWLQREKSLAVRMLVFQNVFLSQLQFCASLNPKLRKLRQEDQGLQASLGYVANSGPAWTTSDPVLRGKNLAIMTTKSF